MSEAQQVGIKPASRKTARYRAVHDRAVSVDEPERRARYRAAVKARIDWEPEEPDYHVFAVNIDSAGFVEFAPGRYGLAWDPDGGLRRWQQRES